VNVCERAFLSYFDAPVIFFFFFFFFSPKDEIKKEEQGVCRKVAASLKTNHLQ
jgi:hypothetical protein